MTESYPCKRLRHDWSHHPDAGLPRRCFNCLAQQRPVENKSRSAAYDYRYVFTHDKLGNPVQHENHQTDVKDWVAGWRPRAGRGGAEAGK